MPQSLSTTNPSIHQHDFYTHSELLTNVLVADCLSTGLKLDIFSIKDIFIVLGVWVFWLMYDLFNAAVFVKKAYANKT